MISLNLTHLGHDGSCYFNNYRRTKLRIMIRQTLPESLDCWEDIAMQLTGSQFKYMRYSPQIT